LPWCTSAPRASYRGGFRLLGAFCAHSSPRAPASPNAPRETQSSEVHELAGAREVDGSRQRPGHGSPKRRPRVAKAQAAGRQGTGRGSPRHRPRVAKAQATGRQGTGHGSRQGAGAAPNRPLVRPRLANMVADPGSVVDRVYPRARCQGRTPTGAAAHDRGDGQALRFGQPPPWSGPDTIRETVKPHLMSIKGVSGSHCYQIWPA
jgi:hypothetical protein